MAGHGRDEWAGAVGDRWLTHIDRYESMIAQIGETAIARAAFQPGESVVDIGCGGGPTSLAIARIVGPEGRVHGVDVAPQLVATAQRRAEEAGLSHVRFTTADAQTATPDDAPFDRLFSRFGVMFFDDSDAAFANMRRWLKPGGRIDFACWASPEKNPWMGLVGAAIAQHVTMPPRDLAAPGPFRFHDPEATRAMLDRAGYNAIDIIPHEAEQSLGGQGATIEDAADFLMASMDVDALLGDEAPTRSATVRAAIKDVLTPFVRNGTVWMQGAVWLVSARG